MQHVELGKGLPAGAHLLHPGLVFAAPGVGECRPIEFIPKAAEDLFGLARDRCAPVHQGPEHVEKQRADVRLGGVYKQPLSGTPKRPVSGRRDRC